MSEETAKKLVHAAISAGVFNDLGSGSNVDLCVITPGKVDYLRNYDVANPRKYPAQGYAFARGTTPVLRQGTKKIIAATELGSQKLPAGESAMDTR